MYAEDMSIFWNQSKGQYEPKGNTVYDNNNSFTKTADQRLRYSEQISYSEADYDDNNISSEEAIKLGSWLGTFSLLLIPGVNIVSVIVWAISSKSPSKKSFARALLLFSLILVTLALIFMVLTCEKIEYSDIFNKFISLGSKLLGTLIRLF